MSPVERFWSRATPKASNECWTWQGWTDQDGYGVIYWNGQNRRAHRVSYALAYGTWAAVVMHMCDQPSCVNPNHLQSGTPQTNVADRVAKGRSARGERHHRAKLTETQVREIHMRHQAGERKANLSREYGVSPTTLGRIVSGKIWSHLELSRV